MMDDLFKTEPRAPLAEALRPKTLDEVIGQGHLLGEGKPLRLAFQAGKPHSMILWGPPGVGKTTLARLTAHAFDAEFIALSAVFAGVKDIRAAMEQAQQNLDRHGKHTLLFVDEIHRFNKSQQDALLPFVESGLVTFIGATTENPSFEVNSALLSRAQVYVLKSLTDEEMRQLLAKAQKDALPHLQFDAAAADTLIGYADGAGRQRRQFGWRAENRRHLRRKRDDTERAPLRQGRRQFLRPDFGPAQIGARLQSGRRAVLVLPHDRRRR
jgi:putative ATPase